MERGACSPFDHDADVELISTYVPRYLCDCLTVVFLMDEFQPRRGEIIYSINWNPAVSKVRSQILL